MTAGEAVGALFQLTKGRARRADARCMRALHILQGAREASRRYYSTPCTDIPQQPGVP
jgi:hypothetical protein